MVADLSNLYRRDIIDILIGDKRIITEDDIEVYLKYLRASEIEAIFKMFNIDPFIKRDPSRWEIMADLLKKTIENNCYNDVLTYIFSIIDSSQLRLNDRKDATEYFVNHILEYINKQFARNGIVLREGNHSTIHLIVTESPLISIGIERIIDLQYVRQLAKECEQDFYSNNIDSIMTKTRTMLEEVFISILEANNDFKEEHKGRIRDLFEDVRKSCKLDSPSLPKEVNAIMSSLASIVENVGNIRNNYSNSHGLGNKRSSLSSNEAKLVLNSAITLMEYVLSVNREK